MRYSADFELIPLGDREIRVTRAFAAAPALVYDAFTRPELVRRWLLGPPGWTMPRCEIDLRVGGAYRYVWQSEADGAQMGVRGSFREVVAPERLVATERFDEAWYAGEALVTTVFGAVDAHTRVTITIHYESREARDTASRSGMERGLAASHERLAALLASFPGEHP